MDYFTAGLALALSTAFVTFIVFVFWYIVSGKGNNDGL